MKALRPASGRKGYFFIMDAMIALFIIMVGVYLITSSYLSVPQQAQVALLSDDLLSFLSNTKIKNLNNPYAGIGGELWKEGIIKDEDNTLLQQIGELYSVNRLDVAAVFVSNVSRGVIPPQFNYELWIDNRIIYPAAIDAVHEESRNNTRLLLTSKKITFGVTNATTGELWGPYKAEVYVWEK